MSSQVVASLRHRHVTSPFRLSPDALADFCGSTTHHLFDCLDSEPQKTVLVPEANQPWPHRLSSCGDESATQPISPSLPLNLTPCNSANGHFSTGSQISIPPSQQRHRQSGKGHRRDKPPHQDRDDSNDGGRGGGRKREGRRFPRPKETPSMLDCPFRKFDPARYGQTCRGYGRFCDVKLHIKRHHILEVDDLYCAECREEFGNGPNAVALRDEHMRIATCVQQTAADAGILLPEEYVRVAQGLDDLGSTSSAETKWEFLWHEIFRTEPPSPYVEDTATTAEAYRRRADDYQRRAINLIPRMVEELLLHRYENNDQVLSISGQFYSNIFGSTLIAQGPLLPSAFVPGPSQPGNNTIIDFGGPPNPFPGLNFEVPMEGPFNDAWLFNTDYNPQ